MRVIVLALLFAILRPFLHAGPIEERDAFFASGEVLHLFIELDNKEYDSLRREPRKYVRATLIEGGRVVSRDVGIHLKGAAGSWRNLDQKPGLTVNMNKFGGKKLLHGLDKFHLCNSVQDPSYLSELICGELYRAAGVPASRIAHAVVTINGRRQGLYYLKEGYDRYFRRKFFDSPRGNFYDGGFLREIDQPLQLLSGTMDVKPHTELKVLVTAAREKPAERFQKLDKLLDMERFLSYLCLQVITWDWDGYPMNRNNYRVYHEPRRDKIIFLPSGMDQMFADVNGTILPNFNGFIARATLETPEGRARYLKRMEEIMTQIYNVETLVKRLDALEKKLRPILAWVDPGAARDYPNQVKRLRDAIRARGKSIDTQLKKIKK